jgi:nucleoid DNA-binding protein
MNIVVDLIIEYLQHNRRLVIPSFGTFIVKESGEFIFSDLLVVDDGVLASLLREHGMNEMEAAVSIDRFIFTIRHELEEYGYCRLGQVGTLRRDPETGVLKLYPPVTGTMPEPAPYVPEPIVDAVEISYEETHDTKAESEVLTSGNLFDGVEDAATFVEAQSQQDSELEDDPIEEAELPTESDLVEEPSGVETEQCEVLQDAESNDSEAEVAPIMEVAATPKVASKPANKPTQKFDLVMVVAIAVAVVALAAICYGLFA